MIKIAMIGAGSVVFSKNLTGHILGYPEFRQATFSYMDIDADRLAVGAAMCRKVARGLGAEPTIEATLDRRRALDGADFVICMVQVGGMDSTLIDFEIARKYGLSYTIADSTGPGGLFRALRTFPVLKGLAADMQELCPKALLMNYTNPMSANMMAIDRTSSIRAVGLCHSVQGTFGSLCGYLGESPDEVRYLVAGINHMAFFLELEKGGVDLYPRLFKCLDDPNTFKRNKVRFELMRRLGYFVTESSEHNAEYCPYFIPHGSQTIRDFDVPIDEYLRRCDGIEDEFQRLKTESQSDAPLPHSPGHEYAPDIIRSMVGGSPIVIYGNLRNDGAISNLPHWAIVETPTLVDRNGPRLTTVGDLPPQLVGYIQPHVIQHELFIRAALEGRRDHVYQACMFDPLTAATLRLDQIVEMCDDLIHAHGPSLPALDSKRTLVPTSGRTFSPPDLAQLRADYATRMQGTTDDMIKDWRIVGPFFAPQQATVEPATGTGDASRNKRISLETPTPVEDGSPRLPAQGNIDLGASFGEWQGKPVSWRAVSVDKRGHINLAREIGPVEWAIAYGYAEIHEVHAREAWLQAGSDDGIAIWLNGELVHQHEVGRSHSARSDNVRVRLAAGVNRLLVKVDNYVSGWGFSVAIEKPTF